ncbi:MAG: hypothetical protein HY301_14940 [Verrucomicrobia bacterium]|nr:hypothetical protein [Verrucomicrobiota bacterium]
MTTRRFLLIGTLLMIGIVLCLHWVNFFGTPSRLGDQGSGPDLEVLRRSGRTRATPKSSEAAQGSVKSEPDDPTGENYWKLMEVDENGLPRLKREVADAYLAKKDRNSESLLAVFKARRDPAYLKEAAQKFPADRSVQLAVILSDEFKGERRQWLERFKESSPDNPLATYLSAREHLQSGRTEEALQDLVAGSGRHSFDDLTMQGMLRAEELYVSVDFTSPMAKTMAMADGMNPMFTELRGLSREMTNLVAGYRQANDGASADKMMQAGLEMARQLQSGPGGRLVINQMVGIAIEQQFMRLMELGQASQMLGVSVEERLAQMKAQRAEFGELTKQSISLYELPEREQALYFDRLKVNGELDAMRWLKERLQNAQPPP